jgi:hypothetical protein
MKTLITAVVFGLLTVGTAAQAADSTSCDARAAEKHLAGAAKTSFMAKCQKDEKAATAKQSCEAQAADKKLHGAAKTSFTKKCEADAAK